jgi:hypothetical protein
MIYGNLTRTYGDGHLTLWDAAKNLTSATVVTGLRYGGQHGFWAGSPIKEVTCNPGVLLPEVEALTNKVRRHIDEPFAILGKAIIEGIEEAWDPDAFHVILHSSGWDSRMMSGAIKLLADANGKEWLGDVLFLSNRWERHRFKLVMEAMEWEPYQYAAYDDGSPPGEHYAVWAYEMWRHAPFPRPANFLWYLPKWAETEGLIPRENVQAFTGLWANEYWHHFIADNTAWPEQVKERFRWQMIASLPVKADKVEYPLVSLPVLDILRYTHYLNGNLLRKHMSAYLNPWAAKVRPRVRVSDGYHVLSERLRKEMDTYYKMTEFGKHKEWEVPEHSGNSTMWGRWTTALLVEKLIDIGIKCTFVER